MKRIIIIIMTFLIFVVNVTGVAGLSRLTIQEEAMHIVTKKQGAIGNNQYINGTGGAALDDFKMIYAIINGQKEFMYCIEPGVVSSSGINYVDGDENNLFQTVYNNKTSWQTKKDLVEKILSIIPSENRYDNGTIDRRINYLVIQVLIWEVMCEERISNFSLVTSAKTPIMTLLSFNSLDYFNRFNALYNHYVSIMTKYDLNPSFVGSTVELGKYNYDTRNYYNDLKDTNGVLNNFSISGNFNFSILDNVLTVSSSRSLVTALVNVVSKYIYANRTIQGYTSGSYQKIVTSNYNNVKKAMSFKVVVPDYSSTLIIDPNGGKYNNSSSKTTIKGIIGETITINNPTRSGYYFSGWQTTENSSINGNQFTFKIPNTTIKATWQNTPPIIHVTDPIIITLPDIFKPLEHVTASDNEDGDLTSKIVVVENTVVNESGEYSVTYQVTDNAKETTTKKVTVIINEPPKIQASDQFVYVGDSFDALKNVEANDKEDGDITNKIDVRYNNVDTSKIGSYQVTYQVTDSYATTTSKTINVYVIKPILNRAVRFISLEYLDTLMSKSKWHNITTLVETLTKTSQDDSSMYVFSWSGKDNERLKEKLLSGEEISHDLFSYQVK